GGEEEVGDQPLVDRWRLENAIEGAAERGVDEKVRRQDAVVVNRLVVAAVLERAVAGRGLLEERPGSLRPHRAGRRIAEDRGVEAVGGAVLPRRLRCVVRDPAVAVDTAERLERESRRRRGRVGLALRVDYS